TEQTYTYAGEVHSKRVVVGSDHAPCPVAALAVNLPASRWYQRKVSEGTKGPIEYAFARQRVTLCKEGLPDRTVWLVIKRTVGKKSARPHRLAAPDVIGSCLTPADVYD